MMLTVGLLLCVFTLVALGWEDDFCPQCRQHGLATVEVGVRCGRCGWDKP